MDVAIGKISCRQHGLITRAQLLALGLSPQAIDHRLARGLLRKVHPGVYALPGVPDSYDQRLLAATLAVAGGVISHLSAGQFWGLDGVRTDCPHLLIPHCRRVQLDGITLHRSRTVEAGDVVRRRGLAWTSPVRTLVDLASLLSMDELETALDDGLRRRIVSLPPLLFRVRKLQGRIDGIGNLRKLLNARHDQPLSGSPAETRFRRRLARSDLPEPVPQYEVRDESGRLVARVDFAFPAQRLAIEIDGWTYHSGRRRRAVDLARQNRLMLAGWRFLRFTPEEAEHDLNALNQIASVLGEPNPKRSRARLPNER